MTIKKYFSSFLRWFVWIKEREIEMLLQILLPLKYCRQKQFFPIQAFHCRTFLFVIKLFQKSKVYEYSFRPQLFSIPLSPLTLFRWRLRDWEKPQSSLRVIIMTTQRRREKRYQSVADALHDANAAPLCDPQRCRPPDCWCSEDGTRIPGNLTALAIPQMITITFDDAVNAENFELYSSKLTRLDFTSDL